MGIRNTRRRFACMTTHIIAYRSDLLPDGRLKAGILSILDESGTGFRVFGDFRNRAFNMARALGVNEIDMFGARLKNPEVEVMLLRQGFKPQTWIMDLNEEGSTENSVYVKTVRVP